MRSLLAVGLLAAMTTAQAEQSLAVNAEHIDYSGQFGERNVQGLEYTYKTGANTLVVDMYHGTRKYGEGQKFDGQLGLVQYYRKWSDVFSTRTVVGGSSDDPVFANRVYDQNITYGGIRPWTFTLGYRYTKYYGEATAKAWYGDASYYWKRVIARYQYTHYNVSDLGNSHGHVLSLRAADKQGPGFTQLWLSQGTFLQEYDWSRATLPGDFRAVALQREQPVTSHVRVNLALQKTWHDTALADYEEVGINAKVTYAW